MSDYVESEASSPESSRAVGLEVADERAEKLLRERDQARKERDVAVRHIARWCVAVDERGGSWDEWDSFYKDAMWRENELPEIRKHLKEAIAEAREAEEWI